LKTVDIKARVVPKEEFFFRQAVIYYCLALIWIHLYQFHYPVGHPRQPDGCQQAATSIQAVSPTELLEGMQP